MLLDGQEKYQKMSPRYNNLKDYSRAATFVVTEHIVTASEFKPFVTFYISVLSFLYSN